MPGSRPVILIGHGIRAAGAAHLAPRLMEIGVPVLASWQAKDLVDNAHHMFMGCPGIYGNRAANKALHEADEILAIGNRLAIWNVGYEGIREDQALTIVSLDAPEAARHPRAQWVAKDCREFLEQMAPPLREDERADIWAWIEQCAAWRKAYPWVESPTHDDVDGFINSYRFFDALSEYLPVDAHVAIDCGAACASAFQALRVRPPQRLLSSGGLGEMGCALPAAIGASFARARREAWCISGDGALMLNLQELQSVAHHNLPVKIIVAANDGYLMIKHTQRVAGMHPAGVDRATGVSCPDFVKLAQALGIQAGFVKTWAHFRQIMPQLVAANEPSLLVYHMHPAQPIYPKLDPVRDKAGNVSSPRFCDMSPAL